MTIFFFTIYIFSVNELYLPLNFLFLLNQSTVFFIPKSRDVKFLKPVLFNLSIFISLFLSPLGLSFCQLISIFPFFYAFTIEFTNFLIETPFPDPTFIG